jgi:hypothetical protein
MKKIILCLTILSLSQISYASINIHFGLDLGQFSPENDLVTETFDDDFYFNGSVGIEGDRGLELLLGLGHYSDISHHPEDEGRDAKISITPLLTDLLYNFRPASLIRPYLGAGVGAYFYRFSDSVVGTMEHGTVFGPNLLGGIKFYITDHFFVKTQYAKHFIPPIPKLMFDGPHNFNSSVYTITFGFSWHPVIAGKHNPTQSLYGANQNTEGTETESYPYTKQQEKVLISIQQTEYRLDKAKEAKRIIEDEIATLLADKQKTSQRISELRDNLNEIDSEIDKLTKRLNELYQRWFKISYDKRPTIEHIRYIETHYYDSPWDIRYRNGCLYYPLEDYYCRFPEPYFPHEKDHDTIEERHKRSEERRKHIQRYKKRRKIDELIIEEDELTPSDSIETHPNNDKDEYHQDDTSREEQIERYKNRQKLKKCKDNCDDEEEIDNRDGRRYKRK